MVETFRAEVVHVVPPGELGDVDVEPSLRDLAASRYVLVCRKGGAPSWVERAKSFLLGEPVEAVTLVADSAPEEGEDVTATVEETELAGVYDVTRFE